MNYTTTLISVFFLTILTSSPAYSQEKAYTSILVICEPGYRVYLDEGFVGFSSKEQDGLLIEEVSIGSHIVTIKRGEERKMEKELMAESGKLLEINFYKEVEKIRNDGVYVFHTTNKKNTLFSEQTVFGKRFLYFDPDDNRSGKIYYVDDYYGNLNNSISTVKSYSSVQNDRFRGATGTYVIENSKLTIAFNDGSSTVVTIVDRETIKGSQTTFAFSQTR